MKRTLFFLLLIVSVAQSGCHLIPSQSKDKNGLKKNIFGLHAKNDPDFGEKVAKDPFPTADSAGVGDSDL